MKPRFRASSALPAVGVVVVLLLRACASQAQHMLQADGWMTAELDCKVHRLARVRSQYIRRQRCCKWSSESDTPCVTTAVIEHAVVCRRPQP